MLRTLQQFVSLARLTALEVIRQPICALLAATCVVIIMVLPLIISHTLGESAKLIRDSALSLGFVCGILFGGYAACHILTHEIRRGTAASVLSTPVSRELFFLSKFAGVAAVLILFEFAVGLTALMSTRMAAESFHLDWWVGVPLLVAPPAAFLAAAVINFVTRRPFASNAFALLVMFLLLAFVGSGFHDAEGHRTAFGASIPWPIVPAVVLITMAVLILAGLAVALATRLDVVPTVSICGIVFVAGLLSDYLFGRHAADSRIAAFLYGAAPNWQHFWIVDALSRDNGRIPWSYVAEAGLYAGWYLAGVLLLGMLAFRHMDVR